MPYLNVRGVEHYYEWISTSDRFSLDGTPISDKPTLVFIHGWAGSTRYWVSTARSLAQEFDCLLYDMRGFGRSQLPRPVPSAVTALGYELESYADDLAILLDALQLQRVYLNAHSTGASIAVLFINRFSERVEQAILTCSGVFEYNESAFKLFHQASQYVVSFRPGWLLKLPGAARLFMLRFLRRSIPGSAQRDFLEDYIAADYEAALGTVYTAVSERAAEVMPQQFAQLQVPVLLISGEYDQIIPPKLGEQAAALSRRITQIIMSNTAHFPMLEDPETYLQQVRQFLRIPQPLG